MVWNDPHLDMHMQIFLYVYVYIYTPYMFILYIYIYVADLFRSLLTKLLCKHS